MSTAAVMLPASCPRGCSAVLCDECDDGGAENTSHDHGQWETGVRTQDTRVTITITMAQLELLADTFNTTLHNLLRTSFNGTIVRDIVDLHQFENLTLGGHSEIQPEATFALTSFIGEYTNQYPHHIPHRYCHVQVCLFLLNNIS